MRVAVEDRGRGFQAGLPPASPGLGLASMRERAELSGGTLTIRSAPGAGTRVEASWPLPPRKAS
ncbi:MAG TPA: ATP-binding protein [Rhodocyclaceae bacterium]|nr:ATP-binding protein [Rhodocyclaceae bacterium]